MGIDDLVGLDLKRLSLSSGGLRVFLVRTKTTGPGKNVKAVPFFCGMQDLGVRAGLVESRP